MTSPVVGIADWNNSGKTTLLTKLLAEMRRRGFRAATVKHAHHDFDIDHDGTDSFRHRAAGAVEVAVVSTRRWALIHELGNEAEPALVDILAKLSPSGIIIVEGYKDEPMPKIDVRRRSAARDGALAPGDPSVTLLARPAIAGVPVASVASLFFRGSSDNGVGRQAAHGCALIAVARKVMHFVAGRRQTR